MSKEQKKSNGFDKHFLWGASTASHQIEGGNHNQWSVWELENAKTKAAQAEYHFNEYPRWDAIKHDAKSPDNYVSGDLADHYNRYKEDFDYLTKMNMNAYRFSIEWSRVEPREGAWNAEAITHYKQYLVELRKRDIEPVVTLFHFTLPVWFSEMGGFEKRANVKYFVRFAEKIVHELGTNMRFIIT
ncbi:glycoside hydrolase family 1 protein, partial [Candidatus Saccharibacteria bacterium]|nr:glycoside hydrolase family 1 protein [Candidatus Saccharibacteria bacterium]